MAMPAPPVVAFALTRRLFADLFPTDVRERINETATISPDIISSFSGAARDRLRPVEVLLTGWECPPIDEAALELMPSLRAVIHAAGSIKGHVTPAVFERGILVSSAAAVNARPVAEYTVAMLVLGLKRTFQHAHDYQRGRPDFGYRPGDTSGIAGSTIGIVGASRIGALVARMLRAYDARVMIHDPHVPSGEIAALGAEPSDLDTMCAACDAVTIHAPELPETRHLIDDRRLSLMHDGTLIVNTARGSLIDTDALTRHCAPGRLNAVLDVTLPEPLPADHTLLHLPNVLVTPHIAGSRGRELRQLGAHAAAELRRFVSGERLHGLVSYDDLPRIA